MLDQNSTHTSTGDWFEWLAQMILEYYKSQVTILISSQVTNERMMTEFNT